MEQQFKVTGMSCAACSAHVEKAVSAVPGVQSVQVNLLAGSMKTIFDPEQTNEAAIVQTVIDAGYGASVKGQESVAAGVKPPDDGTELREMKRRITISFVFLALLMFLSMGHMIGIPLPEFLDGEENAVSFALTQFLMTLPIVIVNKKYYLNGFKTLLHRAPTMDALIAVGSGAALVYGVFALYQIGYGLGHGDAGRVHYYMHDLYFESAGMILALVTLGKYFETRAKKRTGEAISKLMDLRPQTATVQRDGQELTVPIEQVKVGDLVVVRPGAGRAVDGVIVSGYAALDEAALTGESIPVEKGEGDTVIAATINKTGFFTFRASRIGDDTTLSQIIRLVEEASASKAPIAKLADKVAGVFVPVVLAIAAATALAWIFAGQSFTYALSNAITVLVFVPLRTRACNPGCDHGWYWRGRGKRCAVPVRRSAGTSAQSGCRGARQDRHSNRRPSVRDGCMCAQRERKRFARACTFSGAAERAPARRGGGAIYTATRSAAEGNQGFSGTLGKGHCCQGGRRGVPCRQPAHAERVSD